jgi:hypothetical protein
MKHLRSYRKFESFQQSPDEIAILKSIKPFIDSPEDWWGEPFGHDHFHDMAEGGFGIFLKYPNHVELK